MNKKVLSAITLTVLLLPVLAFAINDPTTNPTGVTLGSLEELIAKIETLMWIVFGAIAVIMFVIAGITFLTAQGDPEKVSTARAFFMWGVVGVVVAIVAYSIIAIVASFIGS